MDSNIKLIDCVNRIAGTSVESNIVYPLDNRNIRLICQIDREWMRKQLRMHFGRDITYINNKYVINILNRYYYQQDNVIWLIEEYSK